MHDLYCKIPDEMHYKALRDESAYYKETAKGVEHMCKQLENLITEEKKKTLAESLVDNINLLMGDGRSLEEACSILHLTAEKYLAAKKTSERKFG